MILRKTILAIIMLIAVMTNFTMVEADETTPYVYYGTIQSFIEKINYQLDTRADGKYLNCKLYNPTYTDMTLIGQGFVGEITIATIGGSALPGNLHLLPASTIKFHSTLDNSAIYRIEIKDISRDSKIIEKTSVICGAAILATGVSNDTYKQFSNSFLKWLKSRKSLPAKKTFKLWHPQMGRYIVVKCEIDGNGVLAFKIDGKFS